MKMRGKNAKESRNNSPRRCAVSCSASVDSPSSSVAVNNGYGATGPPSPQVTRPWKTNHPSKPIPRHAGVGFLRMVQYPEKGSD